MLEKHLIQTFNKNKIQRTNLKRKTSCNAAKVDGLIKVEVGFDFSNEKDSCDVALYAEFSTKEALHQYQIHPDHEEIKKWLSEVRYERRVVDYDV
jgi:hypothetical protein